MVVKSEACCQVCNTQNGYFAPLKYDSSTGVFTCTHDNKHRFKERSDGYLTVI